MKKLYCALAAAALAFSVNAADYYLIGGFNNWTLKDASVKFTEQTDGTYVLDFPGTLTSGFKINDGTWANDEANFGGSSMMTIGETYNLTVGGSSGNITLSENVANAHMVFNPAAATLLVTGQAQEASYKYDLWGDWEGTGSWSAISLTEKDGKWVSEPTTVTLCGFGIRKLDGDTGAQVDWLSSAGTTDVTVGTPMPLKVEGTNFTVPAGTYTFTVDINAMTILVANAGGEINPPVVGDKDLYLVGEPAGGWAMNPDYKFSQNGNVYTLELPNGLTGQWKVWDGTWDYSFGAGSDQPVSGVETDAWFNSSANFDTAFGGKTTIVFTLVEGSDVVGASIPSKITITAEYVVEHLPVEEWYVSVNGPFNEWLGEGVHPDADGVATVSGLALDGEGFKVKVWNGLTDNWYCNGSLLTLDTPAIIEGNSDNLMTVSGINEGTMYVVKFNALTNSLTVSEDIESAVEAIEVATEAPIYFNLQGVKVANPEHGIYVKVVNGVATKVVL